MNKSISRILMTMLLICLALLCFSGSAFAEKKTVTIIGTNDIHGSIETTSSSVGYDTIATMKKSLNALLLDAGDGTQGNAYAKSDQGSSMIALMNAAGYDVAALGNHCFDYGIETLRTNANKANFPVLCANANCISSGKAVLSGVSKGLGDGAYIIIEKNGLKIGVFAVVTTTTKTEGKPQVVQDIDFTDPLVRSQELTKKLKNDLGCDIVICLCHIGCKTEGNNNSKSIASACAKDGLDLIIDGHTHDTYTLNVDGVVIQQTGSNSINIGKIEITKDTETNKNTVEASLIPAEEVVKNYAPDPEITKKITDIKGDLEATVLLKTKVSFFGAIPKFSISRMEETAMGDIETSGMLISGQKLAQNAGITGYPVVAALNGGDFRSIIYAGAITKLQYLNLNVFDNTIALVKITPKVLYEVMEHSVSLISGQDPSTGFCGIERTDGIFLQFAGYQCQWNPNAPVGSRIQSIVLDDGTVLNRGDEEKTIILCTNSYTASGGNNYTMLKDCEKYDIPLIMDEEAVFEGFKAVAAEQSESGDTINQYALQYRLNSTVYDNSKTAAFKVLVNEGQYAGQKAQIQLDGGEIQTLIIDDEGYINLTLQSGGHALRVGDAQDIYISNVSGLDGYKNPVVAKVKNSLMIETEKPKEEEKAPNTGIPGEESFPVVMVLIGITIFSGWVYSRKKY